MARAGAVAVRPTIKKTTAKPTSVISGAQVPAAHARPKAALAKPTNPTGIAPNAAVLIGTAKSVSSAMLQRAAGRLLVLRPPSPDTFDGSAGSVALGVASETVVQNGTSLTIETLAGINIPSAIEVQGGTVERSSAVGVSAFFTRQY